MDKDNFIDYINHTIEDTDKAIEIIENFNETLSEYEKYRTDYETLDKSWRDKYINRFKGEAVGDEPKPIEEQPKKTRFEDLFE